MQKFILNKGNFDAMRNYIKEVNWQDELNDLVCVNECWAKIEKHINTATERFVPKKKNKCNQVRRSFVAPDSLLTLIQLKRKAFKQYKNHPATLNYESYVNFRNLVNSRPQIVESCHFG